MRHSEAGPISARCRSGFFPVPLGRFPVPFGSISDPDRASCRRAAAIVPTMPSDGIANAHHASSDHDFHLTETRWHPSFVLSSLIVSTMPLCNQF